MEIDKQISLKEDINYFSFNGKKYQIILGDTNKNIDDYNESIKNRLFGNYSKIPAYVVTKEGKIHQYYDPKQYYSNFMENIGIDKISIPVLLENYGSVMFYSDVSIYLDQFQREIKENINVYKKNWRNDNYWDKYTKRQMFRLVELINYLLSTHNIPNNVINSNVYNSSIYKFKGVVSRSNYYKQYIDVNPSFDFEFLENEIKNNERSVSKI